MLDCFGDVLDSGQKEGELTAMLQREQRLNVEEVGGDDEEGGFIEVTQHPVVLKSGQLHLPFEAERVTRKEALVFRGHKVA